MKQVQTDSADQVRGLDAASLESRRVPLERKVILKFHHFGGFFIEYSANISLTGMFIKTRSPKPEGSVFIFEVWLGDEYKLVHGLGEVVWLRETDDGPGRPAGMGVRFLKIDAESRGVIERVVAEHVQKGGEIFDLGSGLDEDRDERVGSLVLADVAVGDAGAPLEAEESASVEAAPSPGLGEEQTASTAAEESAAFDADGELLALNEEELRLEVPLQAGSRRRRAARSANGSGRGLRVAFLLATLAAAMGGLAYLFGAGLLNF